MADDLLVNKAAIIERCVARAREEYAANPTGFATDFTRQDAAILNIQRACEAALDMGRHAACLSPKRSPAACAMGLSASLGLGFPSWQYVVIQLRGKTCAPALHPGPSAAPRLRTL
ncbi:DUF86 domain-containing protein [Methylacidimicrobium tartarophylax]|uniref:Uncharacterized protein n=1 Tax=Methylacidimicrobium tartarophylax TaxID=1041768 RepID=A0A5E6M8J9_9BACT|nr:DUF86 domain-containing protein [Methylacidimicrobium tartarophylax]VVM04676.1 hypothetical protein MAMT_00228 [Methylacidimicrobium tartarophylax]